MSSVTSLAARYQSGQHRDVWVTLVGLGAGVRDNTQWEEALEIGHLTMARARTNVERLLELLPSYGYDFSPPPGTQTFTPASGRTEDLDLLEQLAGPMPLSLRCWYEQVGQVNFMGTHPDWQFEFTDPLVLDSPVDYLVSEYRQWESDRGTDFDRGPFVVELAPDYLHKADTSGGPPYSMTMPNPAADGLLLWERQQTTLVNYLRSTFEWAGFPGWKLGLADEWESPNEVVPPMIAEIASKLEPI